MSSIRLVACIKLPTVCQCCPVSGIAIATVYKLQTHVPQVEPLLYDFSLVTSYLQALVGKVAS